MEEDTRSGHKAAGMGKDRVDSNGRVHEEGMDEAGVVLLKTLDGLLHT